MDGKGGKGMVKMKLCTHFQNGTCHRADNCTYAHSEEEIGTPQPASSQGKGKGPLKMQMCTHFVNGTCHKAGECTYAHAPEEIGTPQPFSDKGKGKFEMPGADAWGAYGMAKGFKDKGMDPWSMAKGKGMEGKGMDPWSMMKGKGMDPWSMAKGMGKGDPWGIPGAPGGWGGADYKPGQYQEQPGGHVGVEGLKDAITRACEPHAPLENQWSKDDMVNRICMSIFKTSSKWYKEDARHKESGTAIQAQALLEEFTEKIMAGLASTCHDKPWFLEIYLSESLALAAINTFKGGALFKRTVAPIIVTHVDESIFRYREEERHERVMWESVSSVGIKADYLKKANKHLNSSFEAAHISAKYGTSPAETPELGMVCDFVQAWLSGFVQRAWDVLNNGLSAATQDQQIGVVTALFQYLCDPSHSCLPHDLTQQLNSPPPAGWDFVAQATIVLFAQQQQ